MTALGKLAAAEEATTHTHTGRPAAGENPAKRDQILDGARQIFASHGFDGASMNDITKAAGVSKGTIYVYFSSKEELFAALVQREREKIIATVQSTIDDSKPVDEMLFTFGMMFARHMTAPSTIRGMRMVLGVIDYMPDTALAYLTCGPAKGAHILKDYLARRVSEGKLKIDDPLLAARQFAELSVAGMFRPALFGEVCEAFPEEEMERVVRSAITMFMKTYAV